MARGLACWAPTTLLTTTATNSPRSTTARTGRPALRRRSPRPGIEVHAGDYLLAVNGRELHATDNLYSFFDGSCRRADSDHASAPSPMAPMRATSPSSRCPDEVRPAQPRLDRPQHPQRRQAFRRQGGLCLYAQHGGRRLRQLQSLLLRPDRQAGSGARRALQRGRLHLANYVIDVLGRKMLSGID